MNEQERNWCDGIPVLCTLTNELVARVCTCPKRWQGSWAALAALVCKYIRRMY